MTILIDTDILIDIALKREPFFEDSAKIIDMCESNKIIGFVAWHTLSNFNYLVTSTSGKKLIKEFLSDLFQFVKVSPTNTECAKKALLMNVPDFEDALQIAAAIECDADYITTRNTKHYNKSPINAVTPGVIIRKFKSSI